MFHVSGHLRWGIGGLLEPDGRKTFHAKLCDWGRSWCHPRSWQVRVETELKMVKMVRKIDGFQGIPGNHLKSIWLGIKHGEKSWEILDGFNSMLFMFIPKQIFFPRNSPVIYSWWFFFKIYLWIDWEFSQAETIDFSHEMGGPGFVPADPLSFLYLVAFVCSGSMFFTDHFVNGNFRILKWRCCTIFGHILWGYSLKFRPYIGLINGRYLQSIASWNDDFLLTILGVWHVLTHWWQTDGSSYGHHMLFQISCFEQGWGVTWGDGLHLCG